jgi:N-acetylmuramoyl-L-alanine amidase
MEESRRGRSIARRRWSPSRAVGWAALCGLALALAGCGGSHVVTPSRGRHRAPSRHSAAVHKTTSSTDSLPPKPHIIQYPIPFGAARREQMKQYALLHYGIDSYRLVDPRLIIWHYTETSSFIATYDIFAPDVADSQYHVLPNTCAHFVIDQYGHIYQLVPLDVMCRQVVGLNYTAIGIENVGFSDQQILDDPAQLDAGLRLTTWLRCRFNIPIENVIGHNESLQSPYYRELVPAFRGQTHQDWNREDMNLVRAKLAKLAC